MKIEMHAYLCDACGKSSGTGHPETAWDQARRAGWTAIEHPVDHTGHVPVLHYCPRHTRVTRALTFTT